MNAWDLSCRSTKRHQATASPCPSSSSSSSSPPPSTTPPTPPVVDASLTVSRSSLSIESASPSPIDATFSANSSPANTNAIQNGGENSASRRSSVGNSPTVDRKARKKDQNRRAAFNYRRKKMEEKNRLREEEMRLVYSRVCLIGYAERLEASIMYLLSTKTRKVLDKDGNTICLLCPMCLLSCDNILNLRNHLNSEHNFTDYNY